MYKRIFLTFLFSFFINYLAISQDNQSQTKQTLASSGDIRLNELKSIRDNIYWLDKNVAKTKKSLKKKLSQNLRLEKEKDLDALKDKRAKMLNLFIEEASGIDFAGKLDFTPGKKRDLFQIP